MIKSDIIILTPCATKGLRIQIALRIRQLEFFIFTSAVI
jgi:hypothetical protein